MYKKAESDIFDLLTHSLGLLVAVPIIFIALLVSIRR